MMKPSKSLKEVAAMSANGVSGSNLATSLRELDQVTPPTQHEASTQAIKKADHAILLARTDTVNISRQALSMAKHPEKSDRNQAKPGKQTPEKSMTRR
jgi:hypothetical protein